MKIYDVFPYNGEEILAERLKYLYPIVDHFIIFESNVTQNGLRKPIFYLKNQEKFAPYADKIIFVQPHDPEEPQDFTLTVKNFIRNDDNLADRRAVADESWMREQRQRKILTEHVKKIVKKDDLIIFSDADEIPLHKAIEYVRDRKQKTPFPLKIVGDELQYNLLHQYALSVNFWWESFFIDGKTLGKTENLSDIRFESHNFGKDSVLNPAQAALIELDGEIVLRELKKNPIAIPRKRVKAEFLQRYSPLSFHYRNFLPLTRLMCKHLYGTAFPQDGKDFSRERLFMSADFSEFLKHCEELLRTHNLQTPYTEIPYLKNHIPPSLYQFGVKIRERQIALTHHTALDEYQTLFSEFKEKFWDVMQGRNTALRQFG